VLVKQFIMVRNICPFWGTTTANKKQKNKKQKTQKLWEMGKTSGQIYLTQTMRSTLSVLAI